jgi:hypothetical protein
LTGFPSATALALTLGADSPCADERCAGNLGLSASGPFTRFIATHVSIRTSDASSIPPGTPSQAYGTLLYHPKRSLDRAPPSKPVELHGTFPRHIAWVNAWIFLHALRFEGFVCPERSH